MSFRDIVDGKKQWRTHVARIKALPGDYRIVYTEIQKYYFKVGPAELADGQLLSELADFFEQGAADDKTVTELIGSDVATFADNLLAGYQPTTTV